MSEVLVERRERIEVWTLNREEARNALNRALVEKLAEQLLRIEAEREIAVVVITGAGNLAFSAGADLKERQHMTEAQIRSFLARLREVTRTIELSDAIFIAALNGAALGGGCELALACDLRVAAPDALLGLTEVTLGIIPGGGGTQRLPRLIGPGRAKDLILSGRKLSAEEAYRLGLINRVAEVRSVLDEALALARAISRNAPIALAAAKHAIDDGLELGLEQGLTLEHRCYERTLGSRDRLEGLAAFREKRAPRFLGK
jgi:enoyl-CoA hydratase/carnithine racemase